MTTRIHSAMQRIKNKCLGCNNHCCTLYCDKCVPPPREVLNSPIFYDAGELRERRIKIPPRTSRCKVYKVIASNYHKADY